jgi:hypothetical protein
MSQIIVVDGSNFLVCDEDGTLSANGPDWHECPRPEKPCPRHGSEPMPEMYNPKHKKCLRCVYSGKAHLKDQEQAFDVAMKIYPNGKIVR